MSDNNIYTPPLHVRIAELEAERDQAREREGNLREKVYELRAELGVMESYKKAYEDMSIRCAAMKKRLIEIEIEKDTGSLVCVQCGHPVTIAPVGQIRVANGGYEIPLNVKLQKALAREAALIAAIEVAIEKSNIREWRWEEILPAALEANKKAKEENK